MRWHRGQGVTVYRNKVNGDSGEIVVKVKRVAGATASGWRPALRHSSRGSGQLRGSSSRRALVRPKACVNVTVGGVAYSSRGTRLPQPVVCH